MCNEQTNKQHQDLRVCFADKNIIHLPKKIYVINSAIAVPLRQGESLLTIFDDNSEEGNGDNKS